MIRITENEEYIVLRKNGHKCPGNCEGLRADLLLIINNKTGMFQIDKSKVRSI